MYAYMYVYMCLYVYIDIYIYIYLFFYFFLLAQWHEMRHKLMSWLFGSVSVNFSPLTPYIKNTLSYLLKIWYGSSIGSSSEIYSNWVFDSKWPTRGHLRFYDRNLQLLKELTDLHQTKTKRQHLKNELKISKKKFRKKPKWPTFCDFMLSKLQFVSSIAQTQFELSSSNLIWISYWQLFRNLFKWEVVQFKMADWRPSQIFMTEICN